MTIQLSVVLWTAICFVLLMVILRNLLFKPLLEVMDKRRARITQANEKKAEYERLAKEQEEQVLKQQQLAAEQHRRQVKEQVDAIRAESKTAVESAKADRVRELDRFRAETDAESARIFEYLCANSWQLAKTFAESLLKE